MREVIEILKDAQKAIERLGGLNYNEDDEQPYKWLDKEIEEYINKKEKENVK